MKKLHLLLILLLTAALAHAQVPKTISYQGSLLTNGLPAPNGDYQVTFKLYDVPSGGTALWAETQPVKIFIGGVFDATLGAVAPLSLPFDKPYWLGIAINGSGEMEPRTPFATSPYSFNSLNTSRLQGRKVSATAPATGQVLKWNGTDWAPATELAVSSQWQRTGDSLYYNAGSVSAGSGKFTVFSTQAALPKSQPANSWWWIPYKGAMRSGYLSSTANNIGGNSLAAGYNSYAAGYASVAIGVNNAATSQGSVALGIDNTAGGYAGSALGIKNNAAGFASVAMGSTNAATTHYTVALGLKNQAKAYASVALGSNVIAEGAHSVGIGNHLKTGIYKGVMLLGDNTQTVFSAYRDNQMRMRFYGGYDLATGSASGVKLAPGGGSWASMSDRRKKENFAELNGEEVLGKLKAMPVSTWNYKTEDKTNRHAGPMAQDFYEAFQLGGIGNDTTITTTDIDGVNMAAIKALIQRTEQLRLTTEALQQQTAALTRMQEEYAQLKALVQQLEARAEAGRPTITVPAAVASGNANHARSTR